MAIQPRSPEKQAAPLEDSLAAAVRPFLEHLEALENEGPPLLGGAEMPPGPVRQDYERLRDFIQHRAPHAAQAPAPGEMDEVTGTPWRADEIESPEQPCEHCEAPDLHEGFEGIVEVDPKELDEDAGKSLARLVLERIQRHGCGKGVLLDTNLEDEEIDAALHEMDNEDLDHGLPEALTTHLAAIRELDEAIELVKSGSKEFAEGSWIHTATLAMARTQVALGKATREHRNLSLSWGRQHDQLVNYGTGERDRELTRGDLIHYDTEVCPQGARLTLHGEGELDGVEIDLHHTLIHWMEKWCGEKWLVGETEPPEVTEAQRILAEQTTKRDPKKYGEHYQTGGVLDPTPAEERKEALDYVPLMLKDVEVLQQAIDLALGANLAALAVRDEAKTVLRNSLSCVSGIRAGLMALKRTAPAAEEPPAEEPPDLTPPPGPPPKPCYIWDGAGEEWRCRTCGEAPPDDWQEELKQSIDRIVDHLEWRLKCWQGAAPEGPRRLRLAMCRSHVTLIQDQLRALVHTPTADGKPEVVPCGAEPGPLFEICGQLAPNGRGPCIMPKGHEGRCDNYCDKPTEDGGHCTLTREHPEAQCYDVRPQVFPKKTLGDDIQGDWGGRAEPDPPGTRYDKACLWCGEEFTTEEDDEVVCSRECAVASEADERTMAGAAAEPESGATAAPGWEAVARLAEVADGLERILTEKLREIVQKLSAALNAVYAENEEETLVTPWNIKGLLEHAGWRLDRWREETTDDQLRRELTVLLAVVDESRAKIQHMEDMGVEEPFPYGESEPPAEPESESPDDLEEEAIKDLLAHVADRLKHWHEVGVADKSHRSRDLDRLRSYVRLALGKARDMEELGNTEPPMGDGGKSKCDKSAPVCDTQAAETAPDEPSGPECPGCVRCGPPIVVKAEEGCDGSGRGRARRGLAREDKRERRRLRRNAWRVARDTWLRASGPFPLTRHAQRYAAGLMDRVEAEAWEEVHRVTEKAPEPELQDGVDFNVAHPKPRPVGCRLADHRPLPKAWCTCIARDGCPVLPEECPAYEGAETEAPAECPLREAITPPARNLCPQVTHCELDPAECPAMERQTDWLTLKLRDPKFRAGFERELAKQRRDDDPPPSPQARGRAWEYVLRFLRGAKQAAHAARVAAYEEVDGTPERLFIAHLAGLEDSLGAMLELLEELRAAEPADVTPETPEATHEDAVPHEPEGRTKPEPRQNAVDTSELVASMERRRRED